jgi:hypothetical protein
MYSGYKISEDDFRMIWSNATTRKPDPGYFYNLGKEIQDNKLDVLYIVVAPVTEKQHLVGL